MVASKTSADPVSADSPVPLPSFFLVGPPRTGTTWLHEVLSRRMILPTPIKETRFFDVHYHRGLKWYRAHYSPTSLFPLVGEIAPTYFASVDARTRIVQIIGRPKIACIFREPMARIESLYRVKCAYGKIRGSFEQALLQDPELLESSRYATHLKAWQNAVGKDRVLALVYDDLCERPQIFLDTLADFIGLERLVLEPSEIQRVRASAGMTRPRSFYRTRSAILLSNWCKCRGLYKIVAAIRNSPLNKFCLGGGSPFPPLSPSSRAKLYELLRPEIDELEILLQRDLGSWKGVATLNTREEPCA